MSFIKCPEHVTDPCILQLHMLHLRKELELVELTRRELIDECRANEQALKKLLDDPKREKGAWDAVRPEDIHWTPGHERLSTWFGLSYASWLTIPRVLMEAMPDRWQRQMAELLEQYSSTWTNWPEQWGTRVQVTNDGKLIKTPEVLINYRHPRKAELNVIRGTVPPGHIAPCGDSHCPHCGWK